MHKIAKEFLSTFDGLTVKDCATALSIFIGLYSSLLLVTKLFIVLA